MRFIERFSLILILLICSPWTAKAQQWLCVADKVVGFRYDESRKEWEQANFRTQGKYVVAKSNKPASAFQVTEVGESFPLASCESGFNEPGFLFCQGVGEFRFNKHNGRYLLSHMGGYYTVLPEVNKVTDATSDTPIIEIGKCSPF